MRVRFTWALLLGAFVFSLTTLATAEAAEPQQAVPSARIFSRDAILRLMHKVNDWQLARQQGEENRDWTRATYYTGVMAAYTSTGDERFLQQAMNWGKRSQWHVGEEDNGANKLFCVETWLELYFIKKDNAIIEPVVRFLTTPTDNSPAGEVVHWYADPRGGYRELIFVDSLYGAPALAMLTKATGDPKYLDILHRFFWDVACELYDKDSHLFYHDKRYIDIGIDRDIGSVHHTVGSVEARRGAGDRIWTKTEHGKKVFWSRGNGWAYGGLTRILQYLPKDDSQRLRYVQMFRDMSAELAKRQAADGLWRTNLDDPDEFPMKETSGSGFFCYGLAWGINHGLLDRHTYLPAVQKAWAGLADCLSPDGKVQWGQLVSASPGAVKQEDTREYVTGTFLLAASEMYRLATAAGDKAAEQSAAIQPPLKLELRIPPRHPYLALTPADIARAKSRAAEFPWAKASLARCVSEGDAATAKPWEKLPLVGYWPPHMRRAAQLYQVALAYAFSGEARYAAWVREGLLAYAELYPRLPREPQSCRLTVGSGLFEAMWLVEITQAYDLVADSGVLSPGERRRIENDLLRTTAECFHVRDYQHDPRSGDMHFRCYNHHAWHMAALGVVGLAVGDPKLVDYAVSSPYGFCHLVAHDIRDDGLFWERTPGYHHFTLQALAPWTEAMARCGVDLYNLRVANDRSHDEDIHYVTDASDQPKSLKLMFDGPPYLAFPDLTFPAVGDNNRCSYTGRWLRLVDVNRYADWKWLLPEDRASTAKDPPWQEGLEELYEEFPDLVFPAMGDNKRGHVTADWVRLACFHRYHDANSAWLVRRSEPLTAESPQGDCTINHVPTRTCSR